MMQPGMHCSGINQMGKSHLVDIAEPLVIRMRNDMQYQRMINGNKTINRVVNDLADRIHCCLFVKAIIRTGGKSTKGRVKKLNLNFPAHQIMRRKFY
jgi:hypothetical protein